VTKLWWPLIGVLLVALVAQVLLRFEGSRDPFADPREIRLHAPDGQDVVMGDLVAEDGATHVLLMSLDDCSVCLADRGVG